MDLYPRIYQAVREIPFGKVASYGQVAKVVGMPRGARLVGWALRALPPESDVPWHRVINRQGIISILNPKFTKSLQKELLEDEGVAVVEAEGYLKVADPPWHQPV